ncbi:MAG: M23 family metallopeptidase [Acidobacteriia bacterium]|nr:M23 family metallopeptidase [Terriglobia bacterium]
MSKGLVFLLVLLVALVALLIVRITSQEGPTIQLQGQVKGLGQSTPIEFEVRDARHSIKMAELEVRQGERVFAVPVTLAAQQKASSSWWRFWAKRPEGKAKYQARAGRKEIPGLQEGRATLHIVTTNDSWGRFFRGGRSELFLDLPVRFTPPQVQVLSFPHYVNQGGAELVVFKVSPGTTQSGVRVGDTFFPSWPVKDSMPETRLCLFAYSYNVDPATPARIVARDDAGNETVSNFVYRVFPKKFHTDTIDLKDDFMGRVVPAIMSQTPELQDEGSLLKNFLLINGQLRATDARELVAFGQKTADHFLWTVPFIRLPAKTEASFADYRTYTYNGTVVDHQTHLGFDLAGVEQMPVGAANDGVVAFAGFFGIFGNAVVIDHGCGLQSLYGHMSSIAVKEGDQVKRGQVIGRSGATGLAGGDHIHFTILLDGIPINPVEWWDPHWIHDRIEAKLAPYR